MQVLFYASFLFALFCASTAETGVSFTYPVFSPVSQETLTCLKNKGFTFAVVDAANFNRGGTQLNPYAPDAIKNAKAAGISSVDGSFMPCRNCGNAKLQAQAALNNLKSNNVFVERVWVTVSQVYGWDPNPLTNIDFIRQLMDEMKSRNMSVGIHTTDYDWNRVSNKSVAFKDVPLWYDSGNPAANFSDFESFGGWTKPAMKQYLYKYQLSAGQNDDCDKDFGENYRL